MNAKPLIQSPHFYAWDVFWGHVLDDGDPDFPSSIFGWENMSEEGRVRFSASERGRTGTHGGCFGYVQSGAATIYSGRSRWELQAGQFFTTKLGCEVELQERRSVVIVAQRNGYFGFERAGGPIEALGRLKYIDGCSDTLLASPMRKGEACLNHLHFPKGIDQTAHTHPSTRIGIVASGAGMCVTPLGVTPLLPGRLFYIPKHGEHKFRTEQREMDVVAYHPDSDFGPTDEEHPMVNRTLVGGQKIDNSKGIHQTADIVNNTVS